MHDSDVKVNPKSGYSTARVQVPAATNWISTLGARLTVAIPAVSTVALQIASFELRTIRRRWLQTVC